MSAQLIFGNINDLEPQELKTVLEGAGIKRLDTAARYKNGESERKIGQAKLPESFAVDTKILLTMSGDGSLGDDSLTPEAIEKSLSNSLEALGVNKVNVLYCHSPDHKTPISVQAKAFDDQYRKGRFTYLGVSNFPASMISEWLAIAQKENYVKPSVYQGQYNLLCRGAEASIFPLLREHGIAFNAYSPLAGGFLLGNFTTDGLQAGNRFTPGSQFVEWYDKPSMHTAVKELRRLAQETGLGMDELALRWVVHHSILGNLDGVILGASKIMQLEGNLVQIQKGPLGEDVARKLDALWDGVKNEARSIGQETVYTETLDALKHLRVPKRPRTQNYHSAHNGLNAEQGAVPWYWHSLARLSTLMILGGFLMLPVTFVHDDELRISKTAIGIFGVAILAAGFSFSGLVIFAVRDVSFKKEIIYIPALISCGVGFLTIFYSFLISKRYYWDVPAYLCVVVALVSLLSYGGLLFITHRKTHRRVRPPPVVNIPTPYRPSESTSRETLVPRYQDSSYYENYIQNMFPASAHTPPPQQQQSRGYDPNSISEEEMQRQQMLMLLLQSNQSSNPNASQSTFRIDWQDQDQDQDDRATPTHGNYAPGTYSSVSSAVQTPTHGYYAPGTNSSSTGSSGNPLSSISRQFSDQGLQPWDGVWRDPMPASMQAPGRAQVAPSGGVGREERRRQIESGR